MKRIGYVGLSVLAMAVAASSQAVVFNFSGAAGSGSGDVLHASVEFQVSGTSLTVIVTNTDDNAVFNTADVLSSVYFNIAGAPTLSNGNAALTAGSSFVTNSGPAGSNNPPNTEWMWKSPGAFSTMYSFGATGAVGFNTHQTFDSVFHGGSGVAGANDDYGLVPTAGITSGNSSSVYANNSMTFTFDLSSAISESDINGVVVTYGSDGSTVLTPEPATLGALAIGAIALLRRRTRKA